MTKKDMQEKGVFNTFAAIASSITGNAVTFILAFSIIIAWAVLGPVFGFSDTWQLVINTGTTIVTFLMVFLIQNTQNRDALSMQLKLDELLRAVKKARTSFIDIEDLSDQDLERLQKELKRLGQKAATRGEKAGAAK